MCRSHITHIVLSCSPWDGNPSRAEELEKLKDIHSNPRYFDNNRRRDALHDWRMARMRASWRASLHVSNNFCSLKVLTIDTTNLMCSSGCRRLDTMRGLFNYSILRSDGRNVEVRVLGVRNGGEWDLVHTWRYSRLAFPDKGIAKLTAPSVWCATCSSFGDRSGYESRCSTCHSRSLQHLTEASSEKGNRVECA